MSNKLILKLKNILKNAELMWEDRDFAQLPCDTYDKLEARYELLLQSIEELIKDIEIEDVSIITDRIIMTKDYSIKKKILHVVFDIFQDEEEINHAINDGYAIVGYTDKNRAILRKEIIEVDNG